ncbi:Hsp33 family molecular chaperone HslO [Eubacterium oxidoreducens]|uniref:33 kDa chaperonin n=1 Tax=Eubacterium oxidoreducens TaxID=1732 RepID=A0A1G6BKS0_EUBOX|nr:Hsp33 family molecular chaperone HslO [Eubacterium oxidoreducens]SDB21201.1 molecular chaperone Hsp33 [Eubacterium oxidoreducens]
MEDYIVRATAANHQIRAFAIYSKNMVEEARKRHNTSPVATAAMGRLMSAGAMMGIMMKGQDDLLTLHAKGIGPMKGVTVSANPKGDVKAYVDVPGVIVPAKNGKLDVGGALGEGYLVVIRDLGLKEPYTGRVQLQTGEIGDDLAYYFAVSEQTPSSVGLGVLMDKTNHVRQAGGFIIQLMPDTQEETIDKLEQKLSQVTSVTKLLENGNTPEQILEILLGDLGLEIEEKVSTGFVCNCSHDKVEKVLVSLSKDDLQEMIDDGEPIEVKCHFCNTAYTFSVQELKEIIKR